MKQIIIIMILILAGGFFVAKQSTPKENPAEKQQNDTDKNTEIISKKIMDLSGQNLSKAPDYIFNQTDTEELNLSNNSIGGALQSQIQNLRNLKILNLSNNDFTGVPAEVGQLENLEVLDLSNNLLTGLPYEIGNLSNLKSLDISGNNYSETDLSKIKASLPVTTVIKTQ